MLTCKQLRYKHAFSLTPWHYDEILNERADINEASLAFLIKSRTVHPVRGVQREILVENSSADRAFVRLLDHTR